MNGKVAVVTGGSKGIGFAIAKRLLEEGATVFLAVRNKNSLEDALSDLRNHGRAEGEVCDVRSEGQVRQMIEECIRRFGRLDLLVNNAGVGHFGKTVEECSVEEFRETLETNLFGCFYACHYAIPYMKAGGGGYIFNISSLAGQNAHPRMAAYNASKFGLNGFTEALMQEVRNDDIKVSLICPGSVNTAFGGDTPSPDKSWQLQPDDVAEVVMGLLRHDSRSLPSKIEIRPSKPQKR